MSWKTHVLFILGLPAVCLAETGTQGITGYALGDGILSTVIYGAVGILMAVIAFKVVDALTPGHLGKSISEGENVAVATLAGFTILGICIIIAAAIAG